MYPIKIIEDKLFLTNGEPILCFDLNTGIASTKCYNIHSKEIYIIIGSCNIIDKAFEKGVYFLLQSADLNLWLISEKGLEFKFKKIQINEP
jgi:hypothetical protein